jgi:hypothetical protein
MIQRPRFRTEKIAYTYCLVKYVHNPAAGEMLNIGILMCAPSDLYFEARFNHYYERLSNTFADFNGDHYRETIKDIESSLSKIRELNSSSTLFVIRERIETAEQLANQIMPDRGLGIQFGSMLAGLTDDLESEIEHIYNQIVISQYPQKEKKSRDDEEVWASFKKPLHTKQIDRYLQPKHFVSDAYDYKFDHAFKNEKWHVLKPVTLDYAQPQTIQDRATKVFGEAAALEGNNELGKVYILLGEPRLNPHKNAFIKAKNLLNKIPIEKEIIEENEAEDFAHNLADYMERHGVIKE